MVDFNLLFVIGIILFFVYYTPSKKIVAPSKKKDFLGELKNDLENLISIKTNSFADLFNTWEYGTWKKSYPFLASSIERMVRKAEKMNLPPKIVKK